MSWSAAVDCVARVRASSGSALGHVSGGSQLGDSSAIVEDVVVTCSSSDPVLGHAPGGSQPGDGSISVDNVWAPSPTVLGDASRVPQCPGMLLVTAWRSAMLWATTPESPAPLLRSAMSMRFCSPPERGLLLCPFPPPPPHLALPEVVGAPSCLPLMTCRVLTFLSWPLSTVRCQASIFPMTALDVSSPVEVPDPLVDGTDKSALVNRCVRSSEGKFMNVSTMPTHHQVLFRWPLHPVTLTRSFGLRLVNARATPPRARFHQWLR